MLLEEQAKGTTHSGCNVHLPTVVGEVLTETKSCVFNSLSNTNAVEQKLTDSKAYSNGAVTYGEVQSLNLSMSLGSQSSCDTMSQQTLPTMTDSGAMEADKSELGKAGQKQIVHRKSTSQYKGVTRHKWTGRYEARLWDKSCKKEGKSTKGRQVYLGGYDTEEKAARSYDLAALKYWGPTAHINFPLESYQKELQEMKHMTRQEYVAHLRRRSTAFSRGASMYRGVTRHHRLGQWQARIGRTAGKKDLYLGYFNTQEEAAEAYDIAAIEYRGVNAVTNFELSRYQLEVEFGRRNKNLEHGIVTTNQDSSLGNKNSEDKTVFPHKNNESNLDLKIGLCESSQHPGIDNYNPGIENLTSDNMIGAASVSSAQQDTEESWRLGTHLSSPKSLVLGLNSSSITVWDASIRA